MLERLNQKQSSINFKEMNEQEQNRQRILQDISLMPLRRVQKDHNYVFTRNLNQLDKLQNSTGDIINSNRSPRSKSVLDMMQTKFNTQFIQRTVRAHQSSLDMMDMKYQSLFIDRPEPLPQERAILYKKGKFIDDQYHIIEISKSLNDGLYITAYPMNQPNNYKVLKIQSMNKNESIISGSSNQNRDTKIFEFMKQFNHDYDKLAESLKIVGDRLKIVKVSNYDLTKQDFYDSLQTKINRITKSKPRDNSKMRMTLDQINNKQKSQEQSNIEAKNLSMFSQLYQTSKSSGIKVVKKNNQNLNSTLINSDYQIQDLNSTLYASTRNQYSTFDKIKSQRPSDMSRIKITNSASIVQTNKTNQELLPKIKTKLQLQNQSKNNELNITVKHDQTFGKQKLSQNDIKISNEMSIQDQMDLHSKVNTLAQQTQLHIDYIEEQQIQSISPPTKHISFKETQLSVAQQEKRLNSQQEKANSILQDQKSIKAGVEQNIIQWQDPIQISSADTQSLQNPQISYVYSENSNSMNVKTNRLNKAITIQDVSNNHLNNGQSVQKQNTQALQKNHDFDKNEGIQLKQSNIPPMSNIEEDIDLNSSSSSKMKQHQNKRNQEIQENDLDQKARSINQSSQDAIPQNMYDDYDLDKFESETFSQNKSLRPNSVMHSKNFNQNEILQFAQKAQQ
eukprot:403365422